MVCATLGEHKNYRAGEGEEDWREMNVKNKKQQQQQQQHKLDQQNFPTQTHKEHKGRLNLKVTSTRSVVLTLG